MYKKGRASKTCSGQRRPASEQEPPTRLVLMAHADASGFGYHFAGRTFQKGG